LLQEIGSRVALRETLLDLRTSRVRRPSAWPGNFQQNRVAVGGKLQSGWGVAEEFVIDEDFGAVGISGKSDCADAIGGGR
jgi:hypothetical protein